MPEKETAAPFKLPYPTAAGEVKAGATDIEELANRLATIFKERFLTIATHAVSFTAAAGELVEATGAITVTLPTAAENAIVGVLANGHAVKIKAAGAGKIFGDFLAEAGVTECNLVGMQHLILVADGTNWFIVAGEPKREQVYKEKSFSKAEAEAGVEPSATRDAVVNIFEAEAGKLVTVGGVTVGGTSTSGISFRVPAGAKWKTTVFVNSSTLIL